MYFVREVTTLIAIWMCIKTRLAGAYFDSFEHSETETVDGKDPLGLIFKKFYLSLV